MQKTNYKNTLNMPETKFPMKGNLQKKEQEILKEWNQQNLYKKIRESKKGKKIFILHDGPIYANGNIHIGHAINKILKDIIIKEKGLMGYDAPYIPGWDCHGLPIEIEVEKNIKKLGKKINSYKFRQSCQEYVKKQIIKQKKDFIQLGIIGDWENPYLTMDKITTANTIRTLKNIISNKQVYQGIKPTYWCINCSSTLAESEIEYKNTKSLSIYCIFQINEIEKITKIFKTPIFYNRISLIVWTTNPWTLPGNQAISIHPEQYYQLIKINKQIIIINEKLVDTIIQKIKIKNWKILSTIKGKYLENIKCQHPFMKLTIPIVLDNNITNKIGTGLVHIAPGHGLIDYMISKKYKLKIINLINENGIYTSDVFKKLNGFNIKEVNNKIIKILNETNTLFYIDNIKHSYPHCWRHKTKVIFRSTPQWFIKIPKKNILDSSDKTLLDQIHWNPKWGKSRIKTMMINCPDWCISRQRTWGTPLPLFIHKKTKKLHPNTINIMEDIAKMIEKHGTQAWWNIKTEKILNNKDSINYSKITDTLDVWFDSGSTYFTVIKTRPEFMKNTPNIYLEGHDQYRGWFMSSLIISNAIEKKPPYHKIISHGFAVDKDGYKMSKSKGNIIQPKSITNNFGADILRLWIASINYTNEITISNKTIKHTIDIYRKIRNTSRFLLGNLYDFDPNLHIVKKKNMIAIDRWAISYTNKIQKKIISLYEIYDFHNVIKNIMKFCSIKMSSFYLDIIKDRQYTTKKNSNNRRSCQTAIYHIIESLVRWISPIISFTAHEIWNFIPGKRKQFVFTETWYSNLFSIENTEKLNNEYWKLIQKIRNEINKIIEKEKNKKTINSPHEANVILYAKPKLAKKLKILSTELYFALSTASAKIEKYENDYKNIATKCQEIKELKILIIKTTKKKCPRCWNFTKTNTKNTMKYSEICERCINNIYGSGEKRKFI
ncbi:MAG: isoleucine--tRNA ligase [Candidatus Westeberhardia cardiocondylae]|nr:isoleucine--tRNA ligase [Candidatus Westeberhardia cardiocondylae]